MEWQVEPWGSWRIAASNSRYEAVIEATTSADAGMLGEGGMWMCMWGACVWMCEEALKIQNKSVLLLCICLLRMQKILIGSIAH